MNPRFKGFGFLLFLIPVLSYIPLRLIVGDWEESHHSAVVSISLLVSCVIMFFAAASLDRKAGIDAFSRPAWTSELMESQHICFHIPLRLAAVILLIAGLIIPLL